MSAESWRIACRNRELVAQRGRPLVAGIVNVTPDSFFDGSADMTPDRAIMKAGLMVDAGAAIVDIGGASSRPRGRTYGAGAVSVPPEVELARVLPVVRAVASEFPEVTISVDTFHPEVARACLEAGAHIINDITALRLFPAMANVVATFEAAIILMHSVGKPGEMPHVVAHSDVADVVREELASAVEVAEAAGVPGIITDPGFGFGKGTGDNFELIARLEEHRVKNYPIMVGVSRKNSIGVALGSEEFPAPAFDRLFGSLGAAAAAAIRGAAILRTHDVRATVEMLAVMNKSLGIPEGKTA